MKNIILAGDRLDASSEITLNVVKERAIKGIVTLTGRTIFLQLVGLLATFLLTVFLNPAQFGIFFIVSAVVSFFAYFSDIGLAAALIQKKDLPNRKELETTFTIQTTLVLILVIIIFLATPFFRQWFHLDQESVYLLWVLAFGLLLSSLKSIPSVLLERKLDFNKLVIPQLVETILYQGAAVILAWLGFGITSLTIAVLIRGISGLIIIYLLQPWRPGISLSKEALKTLLRFGVPYQVNTFLAVAKDDGMIMLLGGILGSANMGLLGWAQKWATAPLRFFMDQVIKVTFPAFSRMQQHPQELAKAVSKSIFFICLLVFPALTVLVIIAPILVGLIPKYGKWEPALIALTLISINSAWAAVSTPLTNVLNATGKIRITFQLMIMWTILTWFLLPVLSYLYGINGVAAGYAIVGSSSIVVIVLVNKLINIRIGESIGKPLIGSLIMAAILVIGKSILPVSWSGIILLLLVAVVIYALSIYILVGPFLVGDIKKMIISIMGKS